jgi:hypothetical protein
MRVKNLTDNFTLLLLADVSRSLFSKDKALFISASALAILSQEGAVAPAELHTLLYGPSLATAAAASTCKPEALAWLSVKMWEDLVAMASTLFGESAQGAADTHVKSATVSASKPAGSASAAAAAPRLTSAAFLASFTSNAAAWQTWSVTTCHATLPCYTPHAHPFYIPTPHLIPTPFTLHVFIFFSKQGFPRSTTLPSPSRARSQYRFPLSKVGNRQGAISLNTHARMLLMLQLLLMLLLLLLPLLLLLTPPLSAFDPTARYTLCAHLSPPPWAQSSGLGVWGFGD